MDFTATYNALIDDKGRVVLPASLKKEMGEEAELSVTIEKDIYVDCLNIYPASYWKVKKDDFESRLNPFDEEDQELREQFYENVVKIKMAPNGRINIPAEFMDYANLKKNVVFSGMGNLIRMWDAERFGNRTKTRKSLRDMYKEKLGNNPNG